jgi:hypothetical protein
MVEYQYTYLLMAIGFAVVWSALFIIRKDTRKEMIICSALISISDPALNFLFIQDWWHPISLFDGTRIAVVESLIVAFFIGGVASVPYEILFKKRLKQKKRVSEIRGDIKFFKLAVIGAVFFFGSFYFLGINSFLSSLICFSVPLIVILYKRRDLIKNSILSGILMIPIVIIVYSFIELLTPGWINAFWLWQNTPEIIILNVPIDDMIHYMFIGALAGPIYEYMREGKLINVKR